MAIFSGERIPFRGFNGNLVNMDEELPVFLPGCGEVRELHVLFEDLRRAFDISTLVLLPLFSEPDGNEESIPWQKTAQESELEALELPHCPTPEIPELLELLLILDCSAFRHRFEESHYLGRVLAAQALEELQRW